MRKIEEINMALNESSQAIERVATVIVEMASQAEARVKNIGKLVELAEGIKVAVEDLNGINNSVKDIDNQTNLLSLNTAIEAARLGESGGPFNVISNEMAQLANKSRVGTTKMTGIFDDIHDKTNEINNAINIARDNAELNNVAMQEVSAMTEQMLATIEEISASLAYIVNSDSTEKEEKRVSKWKKLFKRQ